MGEGRHGVSEKKWKFFTKWKEGPVLEALKERLGMRHQRTIRAYFDLRPRPENPGWPEMAGVMGAGSMNWIYYQEDFDRLVEGAGRGGYTKDDFLAVFAG